MIQILALQGLDAEPESAYPCFSVSWSDWSHVTN